MSEIIIIGAGLSGLSAACHLAGRGYQVRVIERELTPGGRCLRIKRDGYTCDTGATVMTVPYLLDNVLQQVGASVDELVPMTRLDPGYRSHFADGSTIDTRASQTTCAPRSPPRAAPTTRRSSIRSSTGCAA